MKETAKETSKEKKFMDWFTEILQTAEIYDYRYPVKGCGVWLPYGFKLRELTLKILRELLNETGHSETLFPLLIPENMLQKESEHIAKFEEEVYWVTRGGLNDLKVKYALRPTSETAIYPMFSLWIRSHRDLPVKIYQVVNVFRYETKTTRPIIRVREVMSFKEAHTAHATKEEAEKQVEEAVQIYSKFFDKLALPYLILKRPEWDKFAGAEYSIAFDTIMPNGKRLQIGTIHYLGQTFSKPFEIKYEDVNGQQKYVYQTCYGISGRPIAALIAIHADERGLTLPPNIAPIQAVIIPIYTKENREKVMGYCKEVFSLLKDNGFRVKLDNAEDETPGSKYYKWELRGVPIRVEIGEREVEKSEVTVFRRDKLERRSVKRGEIIGELKKLEKEIHLNLKERAWGKMREKIRLTRTLREVIKTVEEGKIAMAPWCGKNSCIKEIENETGFNVLGTPLNVEPPAENCFNCQKEAEKIIYIGKSY